MELQEFSDQFDVLFNNITSNQAPGLNEYEKSVFLTKAETQLVRDYFNKRVDGYGGGFDGSEKRQYDFSCLLRTESLYNVNSYADRIGEAEKVDRRSLVFLFPENYFLSVNEILSDSRWQYSVLPIDYQEYQRLMLKPYNLPVKRGAWRLITDKKSCNYWKEVSTLEELDGTIRKEYTGYSFAAIGKDPCVPLDITIVNEGYDDDIPAASEGHFNFTYNDQRAQLSCTLEDGEDGEKIITVSILTHDELADDVETIKAIQTGFKAVTASADEVVYKCGQYLDGLMGCVAPKGKKEFWGNGKQFTTKVIQFPMVEIIGKFRGDVKYQMRYVRTLKPIILDDLTNYGDDLKIDGYQEAMECELPKEMHEEILERAVTLAKIAWQGGTATMAGAQSNNRD